VSRPLSARLGWIAALAFASGFPFGLVNEALPVYLRSQGAGLVDIGRVAAITWPWSLKFLWSPVVDRVGTRRQWIAGCLAGLAALTLVLAHIDPASLGLSFWLIAMAIVTLSATQDIAIDAYTIEITSTRELGVANSVRIASYRIAMFIAGGLLIWLAGRADWAVSFQTGAAALTLLTIAALLMPSPEGTGARPHAIWEPLRALVARKDIWAVVSFALLFKLDIAALEPMTRPFWVDRGFSLTEIGTVLTTGRILATLAGAALGGVLTSWWGIFRGLWVLGLVQAFSSLGYWAAASAAPSKSFILSAALFENFAAGMGTAAYLAFLMSICEKRYAATQFALLSALLAVTRAVAGELSGGLAERLGYGLYFLLTFALAFPAYGLLPKIRYARAPETTTA
jgi:MFS transporter, PAT family, beta-lactamase induction signal transducer AmpG